MRAGCEVHVRSYGWNRVVEDTLRIENVDVMISEACAARKIAPHHSYVFVEFAITRSRLNGKGLVAFVSNVSGYPSRLFFVDHATVRAAIGDRRRWKVRVALERPPIHRKRRRVLDLWQYEGEAVRTLLASLRASRYALRAAE